MQRLNPFAIVPDAYKAVSGVESYIRNCGLEKSLIHLVKMRASQINGCAYCLDMHTSEARQRGETEQRLYLIDAWRDSPLYNERERAAFAWTEALTRLSETGASNDDYHALETQFSKEEQVALTLVIVAINGWNRINVGFRVVHPVAERKAA